MNIYVDVLKNRFADFEGRAGLKEYWLFTLFHFLVIAALAILSVIADSSLIAVVLVLYAIASIVPSLAITVRRLHDIGRSGWAYLFSFIPVVGGIILLVFACMEGEPNDNQYGPNPKSIPTRSTSQSSTTTSNFCGNCGTKTADNKFCAGCGNQLSA